MIPSCKFSIVLILAMCCANGLRDLHANQGTVSVTGSGKIIREHSTLDDESILAGSELEVVDAFKPGKYHLGDLALSVGDRLTLTYDPRAELHHKAATQSEQYVYGVNEATQKRGWFPVSYTKPANWSSMIEARPPGDTCKNSWFSDWGSSGMKLYQVKTGKDQNARKHLVQAEARQRWRDNPKRIEFKIAGLNMGTSAEDLERELEPYCTMLTQGGEGSFAKNKWRIYATAGLRLYPQQAGVLWQYVQKKINKEGLCKDLLAECDENTNAGCQTLPGAVEAQYEMAAFFKNQEEKGESNETNDGAPMGWLSSGGASLQLGFAGFSQEQFEGCLKGLKNVWSEEKTVYDPDPGAVDFYPLSQGRLLSGKPVLLFSFLAIGGYPCDGNECDHKAGGVNEMRKQFEQYLVQNNIESNPCLEAVWYEKQQKFPLAFGSDVWAEQVQGGLKHPSKTQNEEERVQAMSKCYEAVDSFLKTDKSINAWQKSGCWNLAEDAQKFGLMTAFTRTSFFQQDGYFKDETTQMLDLFRQQCNEDDYMNQFACGRVFTEALLYRFLHAIGAIGSTDNTGKKVIVDTGADWAATPMALNNLRPGWCAEATPVATGGAAGKAAQQNLLTNSVLGSRIRGYHS